MAWRWRIHAEKIENLPSAPATFAPAQEQTLSTLKTYRTAQRAAQYNTGSVANVPFTLPLKESCTGNHLAPVRLASQISPKFISKSLPGFRSEVPEEFPEGASKRCPSYPKRSHPDTCKSLSANKIFCTCRPALTLRQTIKGPFGNRGRPYDRPQFPSEFAQGYLSRNVEPDLQKTPCPNYAETQKSFRILPFPGKIQTFKNSIFERSKNPQKVLLLSD